MLGIGCWFSMTEYNMVFKISGLVMTLGFEN
jgi:hypothetical protein